MAGITITEALAEIKTIGKRIEKKREFIGGFLARQDGVRDPLEKDGGSAKAIAGERQSVNDLEDRIVALRRGIQRANDETSVTINGITRIRPALREGWKATVELLVNIPEYVDPQLLRAVMDDAGRLVGVGDFRPTFGRFTVANWEVLGN